MCHDLCHSTVPGARGESTSTGEWRRPSVAYLLVTAALWKVHMSEVACESGVDCSLDLVGRACYGPGVTTSRKESLAVDSDRITKKTPDPLSVGS